MRISQPPRKIYTLVCLVMALSLMVFPYGVAISGTDGGAAAHTAAYFSLEPLGRANFLPLLAGILTLAASVLTFIPDRPGLKRAAHLSLAAAILCSPLSWLIFQAYTGAGLAVVVFQLLSLALILITDHFESKPDR